MRYKRERKEGEEVRGRGCKGKEGEKNVSSRPKLWTGGVVSCPP